MQQDLSTAAEVGQALVQRHQNLLETTERDKITMQQKIDTLLESLDDVRIKNDLLLQENSDLMQELQVINANMQESDERIESLTDALSSAKERIMRLNNYQLHSRALESQLSALETTRETLMEELHLAHKDKRVAEMRWRKTEAVLESLTVQYEHLESRSEQPLEDPSSPINGFIRNILQDNAKLESLTLDLKRQLMENKRDLEVLRFRSLQHNTTPKRPALRGPLTPTTTNDQIDIPPYLPTPPSTATKSKNSLPPIFSSPEHSRRRSSTNSRALFNPILGHRKRNSLLMMHSPTTPTHSRQNSLYDSLHESIIGSPALSCMATQEDGFNPNGDMRAPCLPKLHRTTSLESILSSKLDSSFPTVLGIPLQRPQLAQATITLEPTFATHTMANATTSSTKLLLSAAFGDNIRKQKMVTKKPSISESESSQTSTTKKTWSSYLLPFKSSAEPQT